MAGAPMYVESSLLHRRTNEITMLSTSADNALRTTVNAVNDDGRRGDQRPSVDGLTSGWRPTLALQYSKLAPSQPGGSLLRASVLRAPSEINTARGAAEWGGVPKKKQSCCRTHRVHTTGSECTSRWRRWTPCAARPMSRARPPRRRRAACERRASWKTEVSAKHGSGY